MLKHKILPIILGIIVSLGIASFVFYYVQNVSEKQALHQELNLLRETVNEPKVEGSKTEIKQAQDEVDTKAIINTSPPPVVYIDTNPIIDCSKDKCGSQSITKSACNIAVCCEIKKGVFKWANSSNECNSLKLENARQPVVLPHNGQVLYCDKVGIDAIKQASQQLKDRKKEWEEQMQKCNNEQNACLERSKNAEVSCLDACSGAPNNTACRSVCISTYSFTTYCGGYATCLIPPNYSSSALNSLTKKYCD